MAGVGRVVSVHFIVRGRLEDESTGMQWQSRWLGRLLSWRFYRDRRVHIS